MISDWLAARLSGWLAVDPSNAGTTGMLDLFTRDWRPSCWIWPDCAPIFSRRSKRPAACWAK
jgi:sugar (pentulose or hexulose) kinase